MHRLLANGPHSGVITDWAEARGMAETATIEMLDIARMGHRGDAIAETPEGPVYVPYALPGEMVEVARAGDRARLLRVVAPSAERIEPICPHFGTCGGCAVQHWRTDAYRAWKRGLAVTALAQAGFEAPVADLIDAHGEGRRRAVLHAKRGGRKILAVGFTGRRSYVVVPIDQCPILAPPLARAIAIAWRLAEPLKPTGKPIDLAFTATDGGLDVDLRGTGPLNLTMTTALARIGAEEKLARITRHGELVAQFAEPSIRIGRARVVLPPGSFMQATALAEEILARLVSEAVGEARMVADLFCGVGPFALRLAERARVIAFDTDAGAISALTRATGAPGLKPIEAKARDLFRRPVVAAELAGCAAVILDPPRQGAEAQARALAQSSVPHIAYVSCNPATFARDARILSDGGYRLMQVVPVDQFRYSAHVELVGVLER
jgi:23S rRNA (uracil1939-C5)-methyltransferase